MNLLFDLDGTLSDPKVGIVKCIQYALEIMERPAPAADALEWCIGPPLWKSFAQLLPSDDAAELERAVGLYRERFATLGIRENHPYEGIADALARLGRGNRLYLATSKPGVYAEQIVGRDGLRPFFEQVYGSELDGTNTEKGDLIAHILRTEKLAPETVAMVGDREHDMLGAAQNGVKGYGVAWGYGSREELSRAGAEAIFASPTEMVTFFAGRANA